jgi:hypothetical protein
VHDEVSRWTPERVVMAGLIAAALGAQLALHLIEPELAITWSFAHLGRQRERWWAAVALVVLMPVVMRAVWKHPVLQAPVRPLGWKAALAIGVVLWALLTWIGLVFPAPSISIDAEFFADATLFPDKIYVARWYLTAWIFAQVVAVTSGLMTHETTIRCLNALLATVGLLALAGSAVQLARTRGEACIMTVLAWTALGTLQLAIGYVDVYPAALALFALYVWSGLRALRGTLHPAWPLSVAAVGPFAYIGLAILGPSVLVLMLHVLTRAGGRRRLATGLAVAVGAAGLATVPGFGAPFAWLSFVRTATAHVPVDMGLSPGSPLLPLAFMVSASHAREVLHTLILVDGVGVVFCLTAGIWGAARIPRDPVLAFLGSLVVSFLAYLIVFDPVFGAFVDWDLFSYPVVATSLLGTYTFLLWGRTRPHGCAVLLGLALSVSSVHLIARLNALDIHLGAHVGESPYHRPERPAAPKR